MFYPFGLHGHLIKINKQKIMYNYIVKVCNSAKYYKIFGTYGSRHIMWLSVKVSVIVQLSCTPSSVSILIYLPVSQMNETVHKV